MTKTIKNIEANTNNIVIVNPNATEHVVTSYDNEKHKLTYTVSPLVAKIHNELLRLFVNFNFDFIIFPINDDFITITPISDAPNGATSLKDVTWFHLENAPFSWETSSLIELAGRFANYDAEVQADRERKAVLQDVYDRKIKGHSSDELNLGQDITLDMRHNGLTCAEICAKYGITAFDAESAHLLSETWDNYSGLYKELYGVKPYFS